MNQIDALDGALAADALSMPVHWYYDLRSRDRDYGYVTQYMAPKALHPDSILWRSRHEPAGPAAEILHNQAKYWGRRGVHYHQHLQAGENTLNFQLARRLYDLVATAGSYDREAWTSLYVDFLQTPGNHRDTYIEEYHRAFFNNLARGKKPSQCGVSDIHIGGLASVPALFAALGGKDVARLREAVQLHVSLTHKDTGVLEAADCLARMLAAIQNGGSIRAVIESESDGKISIRKFESWRNDADFETIGRRLSPACYIADAFPAALYLAWKYHDDFAGGIVANTNVGGDNCHRGAVTGSLLGLANGVPSEYSRIASVTC